MRSDVEKYKTKLSLLGVTVRLDEENEQEFTLVDRDGNDLIGCLMDYNPENLQIALMCYYRGHLNTLNLLAGVENDTLRECQPCQDRFNQRTKEFYPEYNEVAAKQTIKP